jgi:hypothetical protein
MLSRSSRRICGAHRATQFMSMTTPDHIITSEPDSADERIVVLIEELTRERLLVKSLREENEALRGNVHLLSQREAELYDLNRKIGEQTLAADKCTARVIEQENKFNNLRVDFEDYKKLVEIEKLKLSRAQALPLILAGLGGALAVYLFVRVDMKLEQENSKHMKFELNQMWRGRVREIQASLDRIEEERDQLSKNLSQMKAEARHPWLSIGGWKIL